MNRKFTYGLTVIIIAGIILACIFIPKGKKNKQMFDSPETVVEKFSKAILNGNWTEAAALCDSLSMTEYINRQIDGRKILQDKDSSAFAKALPAIAATNVIISHSEDLEEGKKIVFYSLEMNKDNKKEMKATLMNDGGEWKVENITDKL